MVSQQFQTVVRILYKELWSLLADAGLSQKSKVPEIGFL